MIACYGVIAAALCLTRLDQPGIMQVLLAHLLVPVVPWLVVRAPHRGVGRVLRAVYPILLLFGFYTAVGVLNGSGRVDTFDDSLRSVERWLFGSEPARDWWRNSPSAFWSTIMHGVYFSYYIAVPLPIIVLLARRDNHGLEQYLNGVVAVFLICYLCYIIAPVAGPYYVFDRPTGAFVDNAPARLVYATLSGGSAFGAAFPSSHVAAMVAASIGAWYVERWLGVVVGILTALLAVGVVYCQMHYAVDSVAGVLLGAAVPLLIKKATRGHPQNGHPRVDFLTTPLTS